MIAGLFIPLLSLPMMFASTGLPLYLALYSNLPPVFNYIAVVALLVLIAAAVVGTVHLGRTMAQRWSPRFSACQEWSISQARPCAGGDVMSGSAITLADAGIPAPPPLTSDVSPWLLLGVFGVIVIAAIVWALSLAAKNRDFLPIACCAGALVASFNEPIYDILGKIVYAENNPMAFTAFGGRSRGSSSSVTFPGWVWPPTSCTRKWKPASAAGHYTSRRPCSSYPWSSSKRSATCCTCGSITGRRR